MIQERDGAGGWQDVAPAWAALKKLQGMEKSEQSDQFLHDTQIFEIKIRYQPGITQQMRVVWNSQYFDIREVNEVDNWRREITLLCEKNPNGC